MMSALADTPPLSIVHDRQVMCYARYTTPLGEAGYAIEDVCHEDGCEEQIDRGLTYLCGEQPGNLAGNPKPLPAYLAGLGAAAEEIGRLRWTLRQIITLADDAAALSNKELRDRLTALAEASTR